MKKEYKKPRMYAETFQLVEHIASCKTGGSISASYQDGNACTYTDSNVTLFYAGNDNCNQGGWDMDIFPTLDEYLASFGGDRGGCYNAFSDGNFFAS